MPKEISAFALNSFLPGRYPEVFKTPVSQHGQPRPAFDPSFDQQPVKIVHARHRVMVEPDDHVSGAHPSLVGRSPRYDFVNADAGSLRQFVPAREGFVNRGILSGNAKVAAPDAPVLDQPAATNSAVLLPIAKQIPCAAAIIAVLTPITSPRLFTKAHIIGNPPGLSAASVSMTLSINRPVLDGNVRPKALTMPAVTVFS